MRSGECDDVSFYVLCYSVNGSVFCVSDSVCESLVKPFAICLGVFVILLLSVVGGALLDRLHYGCIVYCSARPSYITRLYTVHPAFRCPYWHNAFVFNSLYILSIRCKSHLLSYMTFIVKNMYVVW